MLLGKYHLVIFKEGRSGSRNLRLRGWFGFAAFIFVMALAGCTVWLAREWVQAVHLRENLNNANRTLEEQRRQLAGLAERITIFSKDLQRVQNFNAKLRMMMNMEKDPTEIGGDRLADFSHTYLPLHRQALAVRNMQDYLTKLSESARLEEVLQQGLLRALRNNRGILASMPSIWPTAGFISSSFGPRSSPFNGRSSEFHKGLDINNRIGTPVVAPAQGTVVLVALDGAYGNSLEIDHGGGIITKYAHLQRWAVKEGQWVKRGEIIGYVGTSGRSTGPHLHYEVRLNGMPVNPMRYILE
ncbi:MAG: M23 family metallopeptidase [Desulfovibrio sp.]|jgi:murein DD-endopeptidase MepM/ murein hydrolase activator NlpD|nr:M23 family metallopeptidase [Desulfovibrio sp.]